MSTPRSSDSGGAFSSANIRGATDVILLARVRSTRQAWRDVKPHFTRLTRCVAVDLERGEALADRHQLDNVDVHVRGLAGRPLDRGGDVVGGQRLGTGVDGPGPLAGTGGAHLGGLGVDGQPR